MLLQRSEICNFHSKGFCGSSWEEKALNGIRHKQGSVSSCQVYIAGSKRKKLLRIEALEKRKGTS